MLKKLLFIAVIIIGIGDISFAQKKQSTAKVDGEKLITELLRSKNLPPLFGDDGVFMNMQIEGDALPSEVQNIIALEEKVIPLLIKHLDDTRLMPMVSCCTQPPEITVGDACLNILTVITKRAPPMFNKECIEDETETGTCLEAEYEFLTGDFTKRGKTPHCKQRCRHGEAKLAQSLP